MSSKLSIKCFLNPSTENNFQGKQIKVFGDDGVTLDESSPVNRIDVYIPNRFS